MTPTRTHKTAAALVALAASAGFALPATAGAATPVLNGTTLTVTGDATGENIAIGEANGEITVDGTQVTGATANNTIDMILNAGGGDDTVTVQTASLKTVTIDGEAGNDLITGNNDADALRGGDGNDRVVGARGGDDMEGGAGNDVLVWNPGDGSDVMDGDAGADDIELNGGQSGEDFKASPSATAGRVIFERLATRGNGAFQLDGGTVERLVLNGNGGDDTMDGDDAQTVPVLLNGGVGADTLEGSGAADFINGGDENDILSGGAGPDRIVGDRNADTMSGGTGDDTLVWNNGDGSDVMDGQAGLDRIEVNGAAAAGDAFTVAPNGARADFDRTNLGPFSLDIGSAEALDVRGQGGDDTFAASPGTGALLAVTANGGDGNDVFTGSDEADTFSGGLGNDTLTGGAGPDLLDGEDGNDSLLARDGQGDLLRGGNGTDTAQTDLAGVDVISAVETIDAPAPAPVVAPPAADTKATAARIVTRRANVRIRNGRASTRLAVECPASEAGGCNGTLALLSAKPVRIGGERVIVVLGNARYSLDAGERKQVTVRLPKGARRLATRGAIAARAQTVTRDAAGNVATGSRAITLRLPRQR